MSALTEVELRAVRAQVDQAHTILSDAVAKLSGSFTTIETETKSQRSMMASLLASLSREPGGRVKSGDDALINIREFTVETGAFLHQFTDLLASVSQQSIATVYRIDDMVDQLDDVFSLIDSINGIADETFILAVNASIEAARTKSENHTGHSFAVIATNIRELSKKTRRFNDQIGAQIGKARTTVNEVREIIAAMASRDLNVALSGKERIEITMKQLEGFEDYVAKTVDRANLSTVNIAQATSQAVTALQFEDVLNQLVASILTHVERLALEAEHATPADAATTPVARSSARSHIADPVQQRNMTPGKVELF